MFRNGRHGLERVAGLDGVGEARHRVTVRQIVSRADQGLGRRAGCPVEAERADHAVQIAVLAQAPLDLLFLIEAFGALANGLGRFGHISRFRGRTYLDAALGAVGCCDDHRIGTHFTAHIRHGLSQGLGGEGLKAHGSDHLRGQRVQPTWPSVFRRALG